MELSLYYGNEALRASNIAVRVNPQDDTRIKDLIRRSQREVTQVVDEQTFTHARRTAAELKTVHNDIHNSKRGAKLPFEAVLAAIDDKAKEVMGPVDTESKRVLDLVTEWVRMSEAKAKEQEREQREKLEAQERAHLEKMRELQLQKAEAERKARLAQDELDRRLASEEARRKEQALWEAQNLRELELELNAMTREPTPGLVPGGRVSHPFRFKLINPLATLQAGYKGLLRIELDIPACQSSVRAQLEIHPGQPPSLPGIEVTQDISVTVKAASRITS
jgi:hypothetical protein